MDCPVRCPGIFWSCWGWSPFFKRPSGPCPKIPLMEEATSGLDRDYVPQLLNWLETFLAGGGRLVWCSHHREELDRLCGAVLTLEHGILQEQER